MNITRYNIHKRKSYHPISMSEATGRFIRMKTGQSSFMAVVLGGASLDDNIYKCSLCGRSLSVCPYYECMPHDVRLREYSKRKLFAKQRKIEADKLYDKFIASFAKKEKPS